MNKYIVIIIIVVTRELYLSKPKNEHEACKSNTF